MWKATERERARVNIAARISTRMLARITIVGAIMVMMVVLLLDVVANNLFRLLQLRTIVSYESCG